MSMYKNLTTVAAVAALAFGLAACGGGGGGDDDQTMMQCPAGQIGTYPDCSDPPTTYETAKANIAAAETAEAAQEAYDAVKDEVTAAEGEMLQAAVDARIMAINTAARVDEQKMALSDAAGMIDTSDLSTQELVDDANEAIRGLRQALEDADDVSDADKAMYMSQLNDAVDAVDEAQGGIDTATRRMNQMTALSEASDDLQDALAALSGSTPTQALLDDANTALTALNTAITDGADLTDDEKAPYQREADNAAAPIQMAQTAFNNAEEEAEKTKNAMMMATAMKLHAGISAPDTSAGEDLRTAVFSGDGDSQITVSFGTTPTTAPLMEDKDATVAAHYGWEGMMFTAEPEGEMGTYEAVVYSNVGEPTEGEKFNVQYTDLDATTGERPIDTSTTAVQELAASSRFDQSAGTKEFELGTNLERVIIAGSFHGVSGNYYCEPAASSTCAVQVAADGFTLGGTADATNAFAAGGGTWTFKPTNPEARLMDEPDAVYASYGWWIHKSEDGDTFTASAFADYRGGDGSAENASGVTDLQGTATYMGGAAGKYAIHSTTGGTNDAGHFTARATLEADFGDDAITGTIDNFMGADGEARNWSVELMESGISDTGSITGTAADNAAGNQMTKWTIDGTAGDARGQWSGNLYENGTDGVPSVATGTFYSEFGRDGKMVGAFGANKQ